MKPMFKKSFKKDELGVSGAITAMMIILIISSFISLIYAVYIPNWTKEDEAEHSKLVLRQFLDLKENIDDQIINREENQGISVTTRVTLGREGGPIFGMGSTSGAVRVNPYDGVLRMINSDTPDELLAHGRGNVTFESQYSQYINQHYIYEYGSVIVAQDASNGSKVGVMKVEPHFRAEKDLLGNVTVTLVQVAFFGDENSLTGTQDIVVETRLQGVDANHITRDSYPSLENLTLNITTEFPDVWEKYFQKQLDFNVSGMKDWNGTAGDYRITPKTNMVSIEFWNVNALNVDIAIIAIHMS
jgi:hypothetical protein